ncbi:MAG TPA: putative sulfate exporter family transporter [Kofleriaceae bacterium]|nr:putative sulfate exporter family transporter [Kofleriaceae bacterium]
MTARAARSTYVTIAALTGGLLAVLGAPGWLALFAGIGLALLSNQQPGPAAKKLTSRTLQLGVIALGAGMNLVTVWQVGTSGAMITVLTITTALALAIVVGKRLGIVGKTPLLIGVGTAICGGSAIAAVSSVVDPDDTELSVSLAVVFVLNAAGLLLFPVIGHLFGLSEPVFGRWAALAIHDTSSVVGAGLAYGPTALAIATTTKLARALWIVPLTLGIAFAYTPAGARGQGRIARLRSVKWPYFILGFVAMAAAFTWLPGLSWLSHPVVVVGQRALVLALYLIGLSLSRKSLAKVGVRPLVLGLALWIVVAAVALPLAAWRT